MFDLGWSEFAVIAMVLVLVVGPKEMPKLLRGMTRFMSKVRGLAREFQTSLVEVANQDELRDVKKALEDVKTNKVDALADFADVKESVEDNVKIIKDAVPKKTAGKKTTS